MWYDRGEEWHDNTKKLLDIWVIPGSWAVWCAYPSVFTILIGICIHLIWSPFSTPLSNPYTDTGLCMITLTLLIISGFFWYMYHPHMTKETTRVWCSTCWWCTLVPSAGVALTYYLVSSLRTGCLPLSLPVSYFYAVSISRRSGEYLGMFFWLFHSWKVDHYLFDFFREDPPNPPVSMYVSPRYLINYSMVRLHTPWGRNGNGSNMAAIDLTNMWLPRSCQGYGNSESNFVIQ